MAVQTMIAGAAERLISERVKEKKAEVRVRHEQRVAFRAGSGRYYVMHTLFCLFTRAKRWRERESRERKE